MPWDTMWERLEDRTCPHGVSIHEDCTGCDHDAEAAAEEGQAEPDAAEVREAWAEQEAEAAAERRWERGW
jgi:hypothetical protein